MNLTKSKSTQATRKKDSSTEKESKKVTERQAQFLVFPNENAKPKPKRKCNTQKSTENHKQKDNTNEKVIG